MNDTLQVLTYVGDFSLIGNNIRRLETNANVLLNAYKNIGLAVNKEKKLNAVHGSRTSSGHDGKLAN